MNDADKNRCPKRALKRAKSDARCALRKLGLLELLEEYAAGEIDDTHDERALALADALSVALCPDLKPDAPEA